MTTKHTYKSVYNYFKSKNCELLSDKYINNHTKLKYRCSCGNVSEIQFANFQNGERCKECGKKKAGENISKANKNKFTDEQMLDYLREFNAQYGFPVRRFMDKTKANINGVYISAYMIAARFGSLQEALIKSGVGIPEDRQKLFNRVALSDEQLLNDLRLFIEKHLESNLYLPTNDEIDACDDLQTTGTYVSRFGGVKNSMKLIGYEYDEFNKRALENDMIKKYVELCEKLGRTAHSRDIEKYGYYGTTTYINHFGTIKELQEICNVETSLHYGRTVTKEQMVKDLQDLADELGRTPIQLDLKNRNNIAPDGSYSIRFGSWIEALKAAGLKPQRYTTMYTKNGVQCLSYCEYKLYSMMESKNIKFRNEVYYRDFIDDFDRKYRCDAMIYIQNNQYILEIFGIEGDEKYDNRKKEKIQLCKDNNIKLIQFTQQEILPYNDDELHKLLLDKIKQYSKRAS